MRLDLLRGFCVLVMVADHNGGERSWVYIVTGGNRFFTSAAEGFVLILGIVMGTVYLNVIRREGMNALLRKVLKRAGFLHLLTVGLTSGALVPVIPWLGEIGRAGRRRLASPKRSGRQPTRANRAKSAMSGRAIYTRRLSRSLRPVCALRIAVRMDA
jgi:uncharacterized membrane protein